MKKVLWVADVPDWAYDINARNLAKHLPQYQHKTIYTIQVGRRYVDDIIRDYDIIIAMNPLSFYMYADEYFPKVITTLNSHRALVRADQKILSEVTALICMNKQLYDMAGYRNENVFMTPEGLDLEKFKPIDIRPKRKFTVGWAATQSGGEGMYKGWPFLKVAIEILGNEIELLSALQAGIQIPPDRMPDDFYHKIDCLVLLSENEGCSSVIMESLSCGIPVICTKVGYHGETLTDGMECYFVERDSHAVEIAILRMMKSSFYPQMTLAARDFAVKNHDIKAVAAIFAQAIEGV